MRSANLQAIGSMLVAVGCFSLMDAAMKQLADTYAPFQVTALRALASLPFLLAALAWSNAWLELRTRRWGLHVFRSLLGVAMLGSFVYAIGALSLADAYAIHFCAPLVVTALSVPLLRDRVPLRRWIAVLLGFVGVLFVLRPAGDQLVTLGGLAALASALFYAFNVLTIRILGRTDTNRAMVFWFMTGVALGAGLIAWPRWQPVAGGDWPWIAFIGLVGALGQYFITEAFRRTAPSVVAPFEYTALLWAIGLDFALWAVLPDARVVLGAAIVIGGGLYVLWDERRSALARLAPEPGTQSERSS